MFGAALPQAGDDLFGLTAVGRAHFESASQGVVDAHHDQRITFTVDVFHLIVEAQRQLDPLVLQYERGKADNNPNQDRQAIMLDHSQ
jgi:hypothetical protein